LPLTVKLQRVHVEVGQHIRKSRGKLVPLKDIVAAFPDSHRTAEAVWVLIENRVAVEDGAHPGHYQLTREGDALIREQWDELQGKLTKGEKVSQQEEPEDPSEKVARLAREKKAAQNGKGGTKPAATGDADGGSGT